MKMTVRALTLGLLTTLLIASPVFTRAQTAGRSAADTELAERHYRRGNTYNNLERYDEAAKEYELSLAADPDYSESIRNLANIYYFQERYADAIPLLQRYVQLEKDITVSVIASFNTLGQLLRDATRYDEAIEVDLQAIEHDPGNISQIYVMANTYFNAGRTQDAIRVYEKALTVKPDDAFIHRTLGRMYEDVGRDADALQQYRAAAQLDPESQFYRDLITQLETRLGQ
ncbi:MAG: tetratricopeptide repeat protein [Pseudomonadales bacterium]|nr:tetratricopeptide repeat protein [Pseudomonadales bacterium]MCP5330583.1 tetratricopeptide repeat protein [Pseudomonadales bacterium]MCP5344210.1 tetratricopeptide repeat protein [Pseudomonadales bacterium]